ncbi:MAG: hypothetical protein KC776_27670 [Myxococcales bacterium]|nr:hypothetical protein [Myxococcales bacterium]MCB9576471.1 hypothetical protein [Polyangiaceae bacterium]
MVRRVGLRGRTDFRVVARDGSRRSICRGIEISSSGIVVDRGRPIGSWDQRLLQKLELRLPERFNALIAIARPVWSRGSQQAFRFVKMSDADRLTLAEHLDLLQLRGVALV